ncbi:MAG: hypothetical protein QW632_00445 [Ignisphaera sp.]
MRCTRKFLKSKRGLAGEINYIIDLTGKCQYKSVSIGRIIKIDDIEDDQLRNVVNNVIDVIKLIKVRLLVMKTVLSLGDD